ncbi:hypothetical protein [Flavobacterium sp.]|uniref:hypothetical protein n=1 Tax=Flavobacterium sp. TaxID=239 RepID=UPI0037BF1BAA
MGNYAKLKDEELPRKPSELMALVSLADSIDRTIFNRVKLEIEQGAVDNDKATKDVLKQLLQDMHTNKPTVSAEGNADRMPTYQSRESITVSEGELIPKRDIGLDTDD